MTGVKFHDEADDNLLGFAVIAARFHGKWAFCKHRERDTYECPGGHREKGTSILETAKQELFAQRGAVEYELTQLGIYSVSDGVQTTYAMLYVADIRVFRKLPELEIERIELFDALPGCWMYPSIGR